MLSAWMAEKGPHCTIKIGLWQDSGRNEAPAWGIFLGGAIRHITNALQEQYDQAAPDFSAAILESLHGERGDPTSGIQGASAMGSGNRSNNPFKSNPLYGPA